MSDPSGTSKLKWKIFVTPAVAVNDDLPPGETARMWSPTSSILSYGERDAILVDTPVTNAQAMALADWVETRGNNLTTIYTTHGRWHLFDERAIRHNTGPLSGPPKSRDALGLCTSDQGLKAPCVVAIGSPHIVVEPWICPSSDRDRRSG